MPVIDTSRPHPARMYDYYLGGKDHYPVDEEAAQEVLRRTPQVRDSTRGNRGWMHRVVRHLAEEHGVRQFLDLGAGLPTPPNLHEVVQEVDPACRVLYADNDPIVLAHADALLTAAPGGVVEYFQADLHDPGKVIQLARETGVFDWAQPVTLVLAAVMHFVPDSDDPHALLAAYRELLPAGSYLALSHATGDFSPSTAEGAAVYTERRVSAPMVLRTYDEVAGLLKGTDLMAPGVVRLPEWHPELEAVVGTGLRHDPELVWAYGGVGRIREAGV